MSNTFLELKNLDIQGFYGEYNCGEGVKLRLYENRNEDDFNKVISLLTEKGFEISQKTQIDNLKSCTFVKNSETYVVNFSNNGKLRIICDFFTKKLNTFAISSNKCPVKFWQFEVDHSMIDCGMCYILQCPDYSFFVIDSAHFFSVNDDIRLFEFLRKHTPDNLPVRVSGWFFSHGHEDHITKFMDVLEYNKEIIIEGLYYNFVPLDHKDNGSWMESTKNFIRKFNYLAEKSGIPIYKLHAGQYFYIDNIRFDVLCNHEDVYPNSVDDYNDSSTVIMITIGEDKILLPGDGSFETSKILEERYPEFLKCDIVQSAHHGHFGAREKFYELARADVLLFPTTKIMLDRDMPLYKANLVAKDIAKYYFIASDGTVEFVFPLKDSEITLYPDETVEDFKAVYDLWSYEYKEEYKKEILKRFNDNKEIKKYKYIKT